MSQPASSGAAPALGEGVAWGFCALGGAMVVALVALRSGDLAAAPVAVMGAGAAIAAAVGRKRNRPQVSYPWLLFSLACVALHRRGRAPAGPGRPSARAARRCRHPVRVPRHDGQLRRAAALPPVRRPAAAQCRRREHRPGRGECAGPRRLHPSDRAQRGLLRVRRRAGRLPGDRRGDGLRRDPAVLDLGPPGDVLLAAGHLGRVHPDRRHRLRLDRHARARPSGRRCSTCRSWSPSRCSAPPRCTRRCASCPPSSSDRCRRGPGAGSACSCRCSWSRRSCSCGTTTRRPPGSARPRVACWRCCCSSGP